MNKIKVQLWWEELDYDDKIELMETICPDEASLIEVEEMWSMMDWKERYAIYCDNELTEEELEAQKVDAAERETHREEVEGDIE